jgi:hypothetical protein
MLAAGSRLRPYEIQLLIGAAAIGEVYYTRIESHRRPQAPSGNTFQSSGPPRTVRADSPHHLQPDAPVHPDLDTALQQEWVAAAAHDCREPVFTALSRPFGDHVHE